MSVIWRLLNVQGMAGVAVGLALSIMLAVQKVETSRWKKQSAGFERLYRDGQSALAATLADARAAAAQARAVDRENAVRVATEQASINERTAHDFEARLAAARADAQRLRQPSQASTDSSAGRGASMPSLPAPPGNVDQAAGEDRLSAPDALTATEQAIQLDELIKWIRKQHDINVTTPQ